MTKLETIMLWAKRGVSIGATHLVVRQTSNRSEDYPLFVMNGEINKTIDATPWYDHTQQVIDLSVSVEQQLFNHDKTAAQAMRNT